jgi:hypothetical protein
MYRKFKRLILERKKINFYHPVIDRYTTSNLNRLLIINYNIAVFNGLIRFKIC